MAIPVREQLARPAHPLQFRVSVFRNFKISRWVGFCFSQNQKMDGGGDAQEAQGRWSETWGLQFQARLIKP
jgi:hypothetical protein